MSNFKKTEVTKQMIDLDYIMLGSCKLCGSMNETVIISTDNGYYIVCKCGRQSPIFTDRYDAISYWKVYHKDEQAQAIRKLIATMNMNTEGAWRVHVECNYADTWRDPDDIAVLDDKFFLHLKEQRSML